MRLTTTSTRRAKLVIQVLSKAFDHGADLDDALPLAVSAAVPRAFKHEVHEEILGRALRELLC
jgi:hypothetical protein